MPHEFTPAVLVNALLNLPEQQTVPTPCNSDLLFLGPSLQHCFKKEIVRESQLLELARPHLVPADGSKRLRNKMIMNQLNTLNLPPPLIFHDKTAMFFVAPKLNQVLHEKLLNLPTAYTWQYLCKLFFKFCADTQNQHLSRLDDHIFKLNADTPLKELFNFNYFHLFQLEAILKQCVQYLGHRNNIHTLCRHLNFNPESVKEAAQVIEKLIANHFTGRILDQVYL